jgi:glycogen operon protein
VLWKEWNGKYRDCVRRFWKGDGGVVSELAYRLTGSSDLYQANGRRPSTSINFVTCHDGFTLRDLVSYDRKHNEANGENNRDGCDQNYSRNCGAEGPTDDATINALRARQQRNFLATLLLSEGVPMLLAGDELGRSQKGNNNAYCQDNELTWLNWELTAEQQDLLRFVRFLVQLRHSEPVFRRRRFFQGRSIHGPDVKDLYWITAAGGEMTEGDWKGGTARSLAMGLAGDQIAETDERGERIVGHSFLLLFNAHSDAVKFQIRPRIRQRALEVVFDTSSATTEPRALENVDQYELRGRSMAVLRFSAAGS